MELQSVLLECVVRSLFKLIHHVIYFFVLRINYSPELYSLFLRKFCKVLEPGRNKRAPCLLFIDHLRNYVSQINEANFKLLGCFLQWNWDVLPGGHIDFVVYALRW